MKKKIFISLAITIFGVIILYCITLFYYINPLENITIKTGKYYDVHGKELGICKIEKRLRKLADMSDDTIYYYTSDGESIGYCKGSDTGCSISTQGPANICSSTTLQELCDNKIYPYLTEGQGVKAKYKCIITETK